jgi:beta-glucosidase
MHTDQNDLDIEARVDALLGRMTLAEKVGQLVQDTPFVIPDYVDIMKRQKAAEEAGEPFEISFDLRPEIFERIRAGGVGMISIDNLQQINALQKVAVEESRLGIPLLVGFDVIHGYRTIFPIPLAEASTWHPELVEQAARIAAEEASSVGINWTFAPMVDIARDPRWGRIAEGSGEDPFLGKIMAAARVRGFQSTDLASGRKVAACPKHYVGYGAAEGGRDYNTVDISERTLRDVYLPPFKAAIEAGAQSVMSSFNEISGLPGTCNRFTLRTILREEWGWQGVVLSDFQAIGELIQHGVASDLKEAARLSMLAGVDIDMLSNAYANHLAELVEEGSVPLSLVDEAVRRVLRFKMQLGLFEHPYTDETLAERIILREDARELALRLAQESMVLLKNTNNLLPLKQGAQRIALLGPLSNSRRDLLGTWSISGRGQDVETVLAGLSAYVDDDALIHVRGCSIDDDEPLDSAALTAAQAADVIVIVLGESAEMSGEAHSRAELGLPGRQQALLDAVVATGKPVIGVLMCGRPLVIPRMAEQVDALLVAWHAGIRAGRAVADLLFGEANPSGKLTAGWPRTEGQIPVYYAHKNTGRPASGSGTRQFHEAFKSNYLDTPTEPLFPFGAGLSYTTFEYSELRVETPRLHVGETLLVSASLKNTGTRAGAEIAQLYIRDLVGSVTRPVRELKGFQRVELHPGEESRLTFAVPTSELGFTGPDMRSIVEPGFFKVWIGPDSTQGLEGDFELIP